MKTRPGFRGEVEKQVELLGGELDRVAIDLYRSFLRIDPQTARLR